MTQREPLRPKNTWLGKLIIGFRTLRGLMSKPSQDMLFTLAGLRVTGERISEFKAKPADVLRAIFSDTIMLPPHRSIFDLREGETISFYQDMTAGRGLYWSKITVFCTAADLPHRLSMQIIQIDDDASERIQAVSNDYTLEPVAGGTRLTSKMIDEQAGDADIFRSFMSFASESEIERIARNLKGPDELGGTPAGGAPKRPIGPPPRKSAVQRV